MSLTAALNSAKMSLSANAKQTSVSARNVAGASDPNYSRKIAPTITYYGTVRAVGPQRIVDEMLQRRLVNATSAGERESVLLEGLTRLSETVGDTQSGHSLVARIGDLAGALTSYANNPSEDAFARDAVSKAKSVAQGLNDAVKVVDEINNNIAKELQTSVDVINDKLKEFEKLNTRIIIGTLGKSDVTDEMDRRDAIIHQLSAEFGITATVRANNDVVLATDSGVTLFDRPSGGGSGISAVQIISGNIIIGGTQVTGSAAGANAIKDGRIAGLVELRDTIVSDYAEQLDEVALGLINAFKEVDPAAADPDFAGLFTLSAAAPNPQTIPISATGLAASIAVNVAVDFEAGGNVTKLRDGINHNYNPGGMSPHPSYSGRLSTLSDSLQNGLNAAGKTVLDFTSITISWVESQRKASSEANIYNTAMVQQLTEALSNARGVDLNEETALQLELERSFAASAQLISVVDNMFQALLDAVR